MLKGFKGGGRLVKAGGGQWSNTFVYCSVMCICNKREKWKINKKRRNYFGYKNLTTPSQTS